jgi:NDP-4-keto-2,6-dideoxyhexose 3-C-methyltransferase
MTHAITQCRICGGTHLQTVMSLGDQALTGVFPKTPDQAVTTGPVDLVRCAAADGCGLVQLRQSYDLSEMYGMNYGYRSGLNASMVRHLQAKVEKILGLGLLQPGDTVIDIGSNDATTLRSYPADQYELVGVDPTGVKFASYYPAHIR